MSDAPPPRMDFLEATSLTIEHRAALSGATLIVAGELDMTTYERFCQVLTDEADRATGDALTLDLTGVTYMDAHSWTLIAQIQRQMTAQGRPFVVRLTPGGQPERVCRLLKLGRLVGLA